MTIKFEQKKDKNAKFFQRESFRNMKMHQILLHIWSMTNVDWFQKSKKNNHEDSNTMRIKLQRRIIFTFS